MIMYEQLFEKYKNNVDPNAYSERDGVDIALLILSVFVSVAALVLFAIGCWMVTIICFGISLILTTVAIVRYRGKKKRKQHKIERKEQYNDKFIKPLICALSEVHLSDEKEIEWTIHCCKEYRENGTAIRKGRFYKALLTIVFLPVIGFVAGTFVSLDDLVILYILVSVTLISAYIIISISMIIFLFNNTRQKLHLELEASLHYILAHPELMNQVNNDDQKSDTDLCETLSKIDDEEVAHNDY